MAANESYCNECGARNSAVSDDSGSRSATRVYSPLGDEFDAYASDSEISPRLDANGYDDYPAGPSLSQQASHDPYDSFSGDQYGGQNSFDHYDRGYEDYDDYEYDDYDDPYARHSSPGIAKTILIVVLAIVALIVVIGIVSIISGFVKDSKSRMEISTPTESVMMETTVTTTQTLMTTSETTMPTTELTTEPPTTTTETTTEAPTEPPVTTTVAPAGTTLVVRNSQGFVVRSGPGTSYDRLGVAHAGSTLRIVGEVQGETAQGFGSTWYQVDYNGQTAYVIKDSGGGQEIR